MNDSGQGVISRELLKSLRQRQFSLNEPLTITKIEEILQQSKWDAYDRFCFVELSKQYDAETTLTQFVRNFENSIISNSHQQLGKQNQIAILQNQIQQKELQLKQTAEYPRAFVRIQKLQCQQIPKQMNFYYKIEPSKHPGAAVLQINKQVTIINDDYTLELPDRKMKIIFFQSGEQLGQWSFFGDRVKQGEEITERIGFEGIVIQIKLKYVNKRLAILQDIKRLKQEIQKENNILNDLISKGNSLQNFKRLFFVDQKKYVLSTIYKPFIKQPKKYNCTNNYVKNYYYLLQIQILFQCLASFCSPVPFITMIVPIYLILKIHDIHFDTKKTIGTCILIQVILIIYSMMGLFFNIGTYANLLWIVYFNWIVEIASILMGGIVLFDEQQFKQQAHQFIIIRPK